MFGNLFKSKQKTLTKEETLKDELWKIGVIYERSK